MFMKLDHLPPARGFNNISSQDLDYWGDGLHIELRLNQLKLSIYWSEFPVNLKSETHNSPGSIWCSKILLFPFPWSFTTGTMMPTRAQKIGLHAYNIIYTSTVISIYSTQCDQEAWCPLEFSNKILDSRMAYKKSFSSFTSFRRECAYENSLSLLQLHTVLHVILHPTSRATLSPYSTANASYTCFRLLYM